MSTIPLTPADRDVYNALTRYAFDEAVCWPSQARVAMDTGLTRETVNRAVRRLRAAGWLEVSKARAPGARWDHAVYTLLAAFVVAATAARDIVRRAHRRARSVVEKVRQTRFGARFGELDHTNRRSRRSDQHCRCSACRPERSSTHDRERVVEDMRERVELADAELRRERHRRRPDWPDDIIGRADQ